MRLSITLIAFLFFCLAVPSQGGEFDAARHRMVEEVLLDAAETSTALRPDVIAAMNKVERHRFVPDALASVAYLNRPLPIGYGQTISQPFIVALMTDLMQVKPGDRVLEIGTGSGYQAAVLAEIAGSVYSIEIVAPLGEQAGERLKSLGYRNVKTKVGDGYYGWPDKGPFDAIIVTSAPDLIPPPLIEQLAPGGRMVIPAGLPDSQKLMLVTRNAAGKLATTEVLEVAFSQLQRAGHA